MEEEISGYKPSIINHFSSLLTARNRHQRHYRSLIHVKKLLHKWTLKAVLITTIQVRHENLIHIIVIICTDSYMFIIHRSQVRDEFSNLQRIEFVSDVTIFHPLFRDEFIVLNNVIGDVEYYKKYTFIERLLVWPRRTNRRVLTERMIRFQKIRDEYFETKLWRFWLRKNSENLIPIEGLPLIYSGFTEKELGKKWKLVG